MPPALPLRTGLAVLLLCLLPVAGGCAGARASAGGADVSPEDRHCRQQWQRLERQLDVHAARREVSAQPERWAALAAGAQYYATSASAHDCGDALAHARGRVRALKAYTARLAPFDMSRELAAVAPAVRHHRVAPRRQAPSARRLRKALTVLRQSAPQVQADLQPAWRQAGAVDITEPAAVRRAVDGLRLLAGDSASYAECRRALRLLRGAVTSDR